MGIVFSLIVLAAGAILTFAVSASVSGIDLDTAGIILMVVGGIGVVLSLIFWSTWGGFHRERTVTTTAATPAAGTVPATAAAHTEQVTDRAWS